ncbi:MAG: hypothetical protein EZS28_019862 [Streblomastix strix]|uniref:Uncharacterized protein n=1 Tax=Streblomastix strix TaxID=222440 RepID=A0A5J4VQ26_9EUKA|nr:MAG: hypothetical protein EZS28_019862 [Streblomastix strix]
MGGLVFKTFAQLFPEDVSRYVRRWITIGTPFQGASRMIQGLLFGYNFKKPSAFINPKIIQNIQRVILPSFWLLPPKNCPFSPKVGVQYYRKKEIKWYGFHSDDELKCWDYDMLIRTNVILVIATLISNSDKYHPPHQIQHSLFDLIREIQHWQNEIERVEQETEESSTSYKWKQFLSPVTKYSDNQPQYSPYYSHYQGVKPTLWDNPSLEKIQERIEEIRSKPVIFPEVGEFEFINIYGSGIETPWHLIIHDVGKDDQKDDFHIHSVKELSQYCEYMSKGGEEIPISVSVSQIYSVWSMIDGDGTVPCYSSSNDGLRTDARFEIRGQDHFKLLQDPRYLL